MAIFFKKIGRKYSQFRMGQLTSDNFSWPPLPVNIQLTLQQLMISIVNSGKLLKDLLFFAKRTST
ncbi:MAG: hypothetical protein VR72_14870 [Clostridiaceae bacterium BRH_c20a]|nr:MAG: hypothetical protein VR72_14870 [Clostridiaceae bacterium BRH_c20a]